jgi:transposase-like protein
MGPRTDSGEEPKNHNQKRPAISLGRSCLEEYRWGVEHGGDCYAALRFLCEKCRKPFELTMTISGWEKAKPKRPRCKSTNVVPQLGSFMAQTKKKS